MAEPLDPEMFDPVCPSSAMPIHIGDKWTGMVVLCLEGGGDDSTSSRARYAASPRRFSPRPCGRWSAMVW
ncbi:hypothetical protein ACFQX6_04400 [Streptosporangium lutulentum]